MSGDIDMRKEPTESGSSVLVPGADGILYSRSPYSKEYKIAVARLEKAIQDISKTEILICILPVSMDKCAKKLL